MRILNKNLTGARIKAGKDKIIAMYQEDIHILDIAKEYGVVETSMYRYLKKWGISIERKPYKRREKKIKEFKRKFSPELQARIEENTRINNKYIKIFRTVETLHDKFLVQEILRESEVSSE